MFVHDWLSQYIVVEHKYQWHAVSLLTVPKLHRTVCIIIIIIKYLFYKWADGQETYIKTLYNLSRGISVKLKSQPWSGHCLVSILGHSV